MTWRRFVAAGAVLLLLMSSSVQATGVEATLDRSTVQLGDTVTLNLRVDGATGNVAMPDLQPLQQDFTVLGTSRNRSVSVINGRTSSTLTIGVALRPTHTGKLQIPALRMGGDHTNPLRLEVTAQAPGFAAAKHRNVFMEARVTPKQGYVGEQFSYVLRLYYAVNISSGTLSAPNVDGMDVRKLGDDLNYDAQRGGRDYHVLERRYALTPQHAGDVEIPAARFQGESADPMDPNSFFGSSTPISATTRAVSIDVQAAPANWGKTTWLPARRLTLSLDGWPDAQNQARVGQPLNLTMTLSATGLPVEALPALSMPSLTGATVYPDKPDNSTHPDGPWLLGQRRRVFAVVPERPGTLTIPATTVKWWNVLTNQVEIARVVPHRVTVLPALATNGAPPRVSSSTAGPAAANAPAGNGHPHAPTPGSSPWRWIAVASIVLWLCSALAWWWLRRRRGNAGKSASTPDSAPAATPVRQCRLKFLAAARGDDPVEQARSLLAWARAERPDIRNLGDLLTALDDASQRSVVNDLQRRQYAEYPAGGATAAMVPVFKRGFVWKPSPRTEDDSGLPPLYPFKLH